MIAEWRWLGREEHKLHKHPKQEPQEGAVEVVDGAELGVDQDVEVAEEVVEEVAAFAVEEAAVLLAAVG